MAALAKLVTAGIDKGVFRPVDPVLTRLPREAVRDAALNLARGLDGDAALLSRGDRLLVALGVATAKGAATANSTLLPLE
mgnify:CR=1 FL=1